VVALVFVRKLEPLVQYAVTPRYLEAPAVSSQISSHMVDVAQLLTTGCLELPLSRTSFGRDSGATSQSQTLASAYIYMLNNFT